MREEQQAEYSGRRRQSAFIHSQFESRRAGRYGGRNGRGNLGRTQNQAKSCLRQDRPGAAHRPTICRQYSRCPRFSPRKWPSQAHQDAAQVLARLAESQAENMRLQAALDAAQRELDSLRAANSDSSAVTRRSIHAAWPARRNRLAFSADWLPCMSSLTPSMSPIPSRRTG